MTVSIEALTDTIVACATPPGEGAIAIVRLSGPEARQIAAEVAPERKATESHRLALARLEDGEGELLDEAMVVEMHAPRSYTGEDVVELHLHGSRAVVDGVTRRCVELGARLARPGEYTLRAFLHGRMDLTQAEAVADLIVSRNDTQRRIAAAHLEGGLSQPVGRLQEALEQALADCNAALDFPDYPTGDGMSAGRLEDLKKVACNIQAMIDRSRLQIQRGMRVVLCGAPNVGKSTLLNAWAEENRVLVDVEPGTTRDPVEVELSAGVAWSVCDTAGVRDGATGLERRGIEMSLQWIQRADVAVWLVAADAPVWPRPDLSVVVVGSKSDLADKQRRLQIEKDGLAQGFELKGWVSPREGNGVAELRAQLLERVVPPVDGVVVVRQRHIDALERAASALSRLETGLAEEATLDVLAIELEEAAHALGEILGRNVDAAVLERIFAQFCIGK